MNKESVLKIQYAVWIKKQEAAKFFIRPLVIWKL